ncbi:MAG: AAA family ATPase [Candidatus Accumulibacter sp.]|jgi:type II secretory pathway predicted ATPase ExeA|nr:AAA family ATPase [Accumulibacter sp.]
MSAVDHEKIRAALAASGISQRALARNARIARASLHRLLRTGAPPARDPDAAARVLAALDEKKDGEVSEVPPASDRGFGPPRAALAAPFKGVCVGPDRSNDPAPGETSPDADTAGDTREEQFMLIRKCPLAPAARKYWGLFGAALAAPWEREQVYLSQDARIVYEQMLAKARYGGLLAVIGESGAGKTTIKDLLVGDLAAEGVVDIIEPRTQKAEENDKVGKVLKSADIVEAILTEIAPGQKMRATSEAQLRQLGEALAERLKESHERRVVLVFEEAHSLPRVTLRHLKRFMELKDPKKKGLARPLLSIILVGQTELAVRLSPHDPGVREIWQRCEVAQLPPLGAEIEGYVRHRLGADAAARIFAPGALERLGAALTDRHGTSYAYPLAVDNWIAAILNRAAGLAKSISPELVDEIAADIKRGK